MPRECEFCGKRTTKGHKLVYRGLPKYKGGIGLKITGKTKRTYHPNLQKVRALINGEARRARVCAKCLRSGLITKPPKRRYTKPQVPDAQAGTPA